ncbi:S8 family peptidase [Actinomadura sp. K4S16]|uniref:S8 family peptidase n=1 Tax=Actinomadura sp. K4S16 TaxID=1316147 RepID=UPI0011EED961|nr:S8 family peptidase [Actinomadura sp. K4S16]
MLTEDMPTEAAPEGFSICVEGWSDEPGYDLALTSLGSNGAKLLTVLPAESGKAERALVWMPFGAEGKFLRKLEGFATEVTPSGRPKHEALVANIKEIRLAVLREFWQDPGPFPADPVTRWWEVWFAASPEQEDVSSDLRTAVSALELRMAKQTLGFPDRLIAQIEATPDQLSKLLSANAVVTEVHRPPAAELLDLDSETRTGLMDDLADRLVPASPNAPLVCLLDTGIMSRHRLLRGSVDKELTALRGTTPADQYRRHGHGTPMAGLSLIGDLATECVSNKRVDLRHRLESVKILQDSGAPQNADPPFYGVTVAEAASLIEVENPGRRRVFSMPITDGAVVNDGRPTSWSAALDALSFGTDIGTSPQGVILLGEPDPEAARLFFVSAGNVVDQISQKGDYLDVCDTRAIEDPAQAWNVLTVGAFTQLTDITDPHMGHLTALAPAGELSPYSRTSLTWRASWPIKPDITLEGGNMIAEKSGNRYSDPCLHLLAPSRTGDLTDTNATSAATAQAARLGALALARYPKLWPETVRGLLVHSAEWTQPMRDRTMARRMLKRERVRMLRRYGWGVPTEQRVLASADNAVTMIVEDEFRPFEHRRGAISMRALRLHQLPWPREQLLDLFDSEVELRVTLSYFIEPNPSNKGWVRYRYPSHALRFDLKLPTESAEQFQQRVAREAAQEESDNSSQTARRPADNRWLIGRDGRSRGSLHADIWTSTAADLADSGWLAVVPVGGWWKDNKRTDRVDVPVRYSLLVSLKSAETTDIYTPIVAQVGIETAVEL